MLEGEVHDGISSCGALAQAAQVVEATAVRGDPGCRERGRRLLRPGQPDHLVAGILQLGYDGRTDPTGRAGDENTHGKTPQCQQLTSPYT